MLSAPVEGSNTAALARTVRTLHSKPSFTGSMRAQCTPSSFPLHPLHSIPLTNTDARQPPNDPRWGFLRLTWNSAPRGKLLQNGIPHFYLKSNSSVFRTVCAHMDVLADADAKVPTLICSLVETIRHALPALDPGPSKLKRNNGMNASYSGRARPRLSYIGHPKSVRKAWDWPTPGRYGALYWSKLTEEHPDGGYRYLEIPFHRDGVAPNQPEIP